MKVYVFFVEQVDDTEVLRQDTKVFSTREKAEQEFNLFVCDETRFITENHPTWVINDEPNKLEFEAYSNSFLSKSVFWVSKANMEFWNGMQFSYMSTCSLVRPESLNWP